MTKNQPARPRRFFDSAPWLLLLVFVVLLIAYAAALRGLPLWDDAIVFGDRRLRTAPNPWPWWSSLSNPDYWPVTYSVFWALLRAFGDDPLPYHLVAIAIHAVNATLVGTLVRRLGGPALPAALIFALHPVQVESVAYIFQIKTTLATTFFLAALLAWWHHLDGGARAARWLAASVALVALALLTKTSTAMWPATALVFLWWRRTLSIRAVLALVPHGALAAGMVATTLYVNARQNAALVVWDAGFGERALTACRNVWFYMGSLIAPTSLSAVYPRVTQQSGSPSSWLYVAMLLVVAGVLFHLRALPWVRAVALGFAFFVVNLVPALGFADVYYMRFSLVADHWQYLASAGVLSLASPLMVLIERRLKRPGLDEKTGSRALFAGGLVVLVGCASLTHLHARSYASPAAFWAAALASNRGSQLAHNNLGILHFLAGKHEDAERSHREALRLDAAYDEAHYNLGYLLAQRGSVAEAEEHFRAAIAANGTHYKAYNALGLLLMDGPRRVEAEEHFKKALSIRGDYVDALSNLGLLRSRTGRRDEALALFDRAVALRADHADLHVNRGSILLEAGRSLDAEQAFVRALALKPGHAAALFNLGLLCSRDPSRLAEAARHLREGLASQPGNAQAQQLLHDVEARLAAPRQ